MAKVKVTVKNKKNNKGINGVEVEFRTRGNGDVKTKGNTKRGVFEIEDLPVGEYTWTAKKDGFKTDTGERHVTINDELLDIPITLEENPAASGDGVGDDGVGGDGTGNAKGSISGKVTDAEGTGVQGANVIATSKDLQVTESSTKDQSGEYTISDLNPGVYTVSINIPNTSSEDQPSEAVSIVINEGDKIKGIDFSLDPVRDFFGRLDDDRFSIESPISLFEAKNAVHFFSIANLLLAGLQNSNGSLDIFGLKELSSGQGNGINITEVFKIADNSPVWLKILESAEALREKMFKLINNDEVPKVRMEAKRQFNLGNDNSVVGNVRFPELFNKLVDIAADPLLSFNIQKADDLNFQDKSKIAEADELLKELKGIIIQIVTSLSKFGTAGTQLENKKWATFISQAIELVAEIGEVVNTGDQDDKNPWAVIAVLTGKNRENDVAPYAVLGRHGGKLLELVLNIYQNPEFKLEDFETESLRRLFQRQDTTEEEEFFTTEIRREATVIRRYPLSNWG